MIGEKYVGSEGRPLPGINKWYAAALSCGTVIAGAIFRIVFDTGDVGNRGLRRQLSFWFGWLVLWGSAAAMFALVCLILVGALEDQIDGSAASHDVAAITAFQVIQVGYPIVSMVDLLSRQMCPVTNKMPSHILPMRSGLKDICYGCLDVGSKSFFAIYVAFRATWYDSEVSSIAVAINKTLTG